MTHIVMFCEERVRLVAEYSQAALVYARATSALKHNKASSPELEYERLRRAADDARIKCEEARLAFRRHRAEHGC